MPVRVAVIGAGAAGLVALRHLTSRPSVFTALAFEQTPNVGGTWVYTENTGLDHNGLAIHSSMYKNMTTNLPTEIMAFPGFPFKKNLPSFVKHTDVCQYLEDYADHFQLMDHIKFNTHVELLKPGTSETGSTTWHLRSRDLSDQGTGVQDHQFDCVMVCNGHYSVPTIPSLPGKKTFEGLFMHSHSYRHPEVFRDMNVLCLGAGPSGTDIALEIAPFSKQVYLSHNRRVPLTSPLPGNVRQTAVVASLNPRSAILTTEEEIQLDALIVCTGYEYSFPFLAPSCHVAVDDGQVAPLYKHVLHTEHPSLAFIGLCNKVLPFPQFDCQVRFALAAWDESMKLPSHEEMNADTQQDQQAKLASGEPRRYAHKLDDKQWHYNDTLASLAGFPPPPDRLCRIYNSVHKEKGVNLVGFKRMEITGPDA